MMLTLLIQLLQSIVGMVDECKSAVNTVRQRNQLIRSVNSQADINQRAGAKQFYILPVLSHGYVIAQLVLCRDTF